MSQSIENIPKPPTEPLKLTAAAVNYLIKILPKGTAYCIGIVLVVMMTGRLVQSKGSLARAVLPLVFHLKWGWHRVERAMERGQVPLDKMFERAFSWCMDNLLVEPVELGEKQREVLAIDSSTIARKSEPNWEWICEEKASTIGQAKRSKPTSLQQQQLSSSMRSCE